MDGSMKQEPFGSHNRSKFYACRTFSSFFDSLTASFIFSLCSSVLIVLTTALNLLASVICPAGLIRGVKLYSTLFAVH